MRTRFILRKISVFAKPLKLFCSCHHTPLFFCLQSRFTKLLTGVPKKSGMADPFYWAAPAAFSGFSLATKKETKMADRFYVNNFTIRFLFNHPLDIWENWHFLTIFAKIFKGNFFSRVNINFPLWIVPTYTSHYYRGFFLTHIQLRPTVDSQMSSYLVYSPFSHFLSRTKPACTVGLNWIWVKKDPQ